MLDLSPFVQDVIATALATGAFGILVHRTIGAVRPQAGEPPCTTCSACPKPRTDAGQAVNIVPLNNLRRHSGSPEQSPR
jgi:hypothetical protein